MFMRIVKMVRVRTSELFERRDDVLHLYLASMMISSDGHDSDNSVVPDFFTLFIDEFYLF